MSAYVFNVLSDMSKYATKEAVRRYADPKKYRRLFENMTFAAEFIVRDFLNDLAEAGEETEDELEKFWHNLTTKPLPPPTPSEAIEEHRKKLQQKKEELRRQKNKIDEAWSIKYE